MSWCFFTRNNNTSGWLKENIPGDSLSFLFLKNYWGIRLIHPLDLTGSSDFMWRLRPTWPTHHLSHQEASLQPSDQIFVVSIYFVQLREYCIPFVWAHDFLTQHVLNLSVFTPIFLVMEDYFAFYKVWVGFCREIPVVRLVHCINY